MLTVGSAEIIVHLGRDVTQRFLLDAPLVTVGRDADNQLVLRDTKVSRHHLRFVRQGNGAYVVEDLESANGTWVGETRITRTELQEGMTLRVGPFSLFVQTVGGEDRDATVLPRGAVPESVQRSGDAIAPFPGVSEAMLIVNDGLSERRLPLTSLPISIGRSANCDLVLRDPNVSLRHAHIDGRGESLMIVDENSTNGTYLNGERITTAPFTQGSVVSIGETRFTLIGLPSELATRVQANLPPAVGTRAPVPDISDRTSLAPAAPIVPVAITSLQLEKDVVTIGRDADNDIPLPNPQVSRHHARLRRSGATHIIEDLGSTNGTFVNGQQITSKQLMLGDQILISVFVITYNGTSLQQVNTEGNIRLDAIHLNKWVAENKNLLQDISFSVYPREFVALVGVSGAGKSTLMDALNGQRPAQGTLLINGDNLYANYDAYRTTIGYVPQDDIIHRELSVYNALDYAARLRLPPDTSKQERHARIEEVLKELGLTERKDLPISRLSGGQRKRVSMGVELLTKPSLFFLDEPTSGLDPGIETTMMHLLRQVADQGRTIILITHATKNVALCDLVIFLAKGGYLAYFGPPSEVTEFFGVESFEEIYPLLEGGEATSVTPEEWSKRYLESPQYRTYVQERLAQYSEQNLAAQAGSQNGKAPARTPPGERVQHPSALLQFRVLVERNAEIMRKNQVSLTIVMLQAILVSTFLVILFTKGLFSSAGIFSVDVDTGDPGVATTVLFVMVTSGIFIGLSNASKEIVKERAIYRRERAVNLKVAPYLWAKVVVLGLLGAIQTAIMIGVLTAGTLLPRGDLVSIAPTYARICAIFFVTILIGIMFGLLVSALVNTVDAAVGAIVLVFMPQLMFSGNIKPVERMGTVAKGISTLVAGRWIYDVLGNIAALPRLYDRHVAMWQERLAGGTAPPQLAQRKLGELEVLQSNFNGAFTGHVWLHWGILGAFFVVSSIAIYLALRRADQAN